MNCLEFKRLALSDPNSQETSFIEHSKSCPDCLKYVTEIRQMDAGLSASLDADVPIELVAKLKLNQELNQELKESSSSKNSMQRYAIAASVVVALLVGGLTVSNQFSQQIDEDYQQLLAGVIEHVNEKPFTPVWGTERANNTVSTLLSSYDNGVKLKNLKNLTFGRVCPMGKYRGLHANLETPDGPVTFAYIKGEPVGEVINTSYKGYMTRVKPIRNGNLIIISRTTKSLEQTDEQLKDALYWDI